MMKWKILRYSKFLVRYSIFNKKFLLLQQRNKIFLSVSATIRRVLAGIFMVLFAFGMTPKLILHNLVANHKDGRTKSSLPDPYSTQLNKASFNCQCDDLVSESPFIPATSSSYVLLVSSFADYQDTFSEKVYSSQAYCSSLRGPPSC